MARRARERALGINAPATAQLRLPPPGAGTGDKTLWRRRLAGLTLRIRGSSNRTDGNACETNCSAIGVLTMLPASIARSKNKQIRTKRTERDEPADKRQCDGTLAAGPLDRWQGWKLPEILQINPTRYQ